MDIEDIRKGRRRDWDKLKDPVERRQAKLDEAEQKAQNDEKNKSSLRRREEARQEAREHELEEWRRTKRQLMQAAAVVLLVAVVWGGIKWAVHLVQQRKTDERIVELLKKSSSPVSFEAYSSPLETWASWRNACLRGDSEQLLRTYSGEMYERERGEQSPSNFHLRMQELLVGDDALPMRKVAQAFDEPEFIHRPDSSPRDGDLAVLIAEVPSLRNPGLPPTDWVVAISWDARTQKWKIEDVREATAWRPAWKHANMIQLSRLPIDDNADRHKK